MTPTRSTQSYMLHQGTKFAERFDANAYIRIADMWAEFDIRDHTPDGTFQTALEGFRRAGIPALIFPLIQTAVSARRNSRISRRSLKPPIFPRSSIPSLPPRDTIPSCWSRSFMRNPSGAFWRQGSRRGRRKLFPPQEDTAEQRLKEVMQGTGSKRKNQPCHEGTARFPAKRNFTALQRENNLNRMNPNRVFAVTPS